MTFFERLVAVVGERPMLKALRFYPPYLGAGVRVRDVAPDLSAIEVEMSLHPWNQNYVGTHFGGSLYAMVDPFFMLMVLRKLGPEFVVWDKSATIDFVSPGRGTVRARMEVTGERADEIRAEVEAKGKAHPRFEVEIRDGSGAVVARVGKVLSVRRRA